MAFYGPRLYGAVFWAPLELISSWMLASRTRVGQYINEKNLSFTTKNILGIAHPKHTILLLVSRKLEGNSGYFALLVPSNQIYC